MKDPHGQENLRRFVAAAGAVPEQVRIARQVHGNTVIDTDTAPEFSRHAFRPGAVCADSLITAQNGVCLGILSADCPALILADRQCLAAVHASWRSITRGICENTIAAMGNVSDTSACNWHAWICPSVRQCCYEVREDVERIFRKRYSDCTEMVAVRNGKTFLSLQQVIRFILIHNGLHAERIRISTECTLCSDDLFYSYRRDGAGCGHQLILARMN